MPDADEHKIITDKLDEMLKILNGNGEIGLCAKVQILWKDRNLIIGGIATILIGIVMVAIKIHM